MRKLFLISALLLASASAQAGESRSLSLAGLPVATVSAETPKVLAEAPKPITQVSVRLAQAATTASDAAPVQVQAPAAAPVQAPAPVAAQTAAPAPTTTATATEAKPATTETKKPVKKARHESDESKARRIAARYGVYW